MSDPIYTYPRWSLEADCMASDTLIPEGPLSCACGRIRSAASLFDARDYEDIEGDWRCSICLSGKDREEAALAEQAAFTPSWSPTCECGNAVRAGRLQRLTASDWTELPGRRAALGETLTGQWDTYRQALRDLPQTYATPDLVEWPTPPEPL